MFSFQKSLSLKKEGRVMAKCLYKKINDLRNFLNKSQAN